MTPTYFEIVARAFAKVYEGLPPADRDKRISEALAMMTRRYGRVAQLGGPDFSDDYVRAGYLFRYVAAHCDMITDAIRWSPELRRAISADKVIVTSLGGGPGTDVLAIARYAIENSLSAKYYFKLVDKERGPTLGLTSMKC